MTLLKIENTKEFNIFKKLNDNRTIMPVHVQRLAEAVKNNPNLTEISPIIINRNYEVIDGQHRLEAHKMLETQGIALPIYYMVRSDFNIDSAREINSINKPWIGLDFARVESATNVNYKLYMDAYLERQLPHNVITTYLSGDRTKQANRNFRKGGFKVKNAALAQKYFGQLADLSEVILKKGFGSTKLTKNNNFGLAAYNVFTCKNYVHEWMLQRLVERGDALAACKMTVKDLESTLRSIYNRGANKRLTR